MLVDGRPDMEILAEAGDGGEGVDALARVRRSRVVVLVGLGLEGEHDASWLIRTVRERFPSHAILAMGANADPTMVSRALFVGADGYVDKNIDPGDFLGAIIKVADREMVLQGPVAAAVGQIADSIDLRRDLDVRLTGREREVLAVAAEGLTARQIATRLGVRERTVTTHLGRIYGKLGVGQPALRDPDGRPFRDGQRRLSRVVTTERTLRRRRLCRRTSSRNPPTSRSGSRSQLSAATMTSGCHLARTSFQSAPANPTCP